MYSLNHSSDGSAAVNKNSPSAEACPVMHVTRHPTDFEACALARAQTNTLAQFFASSNQRALAACAYTSAFTRPAAHHCLQLQEARKLFLCVKMD